MATPILRTVRWLTLMLAAATFDAGSPGKAQADDGNAVAAISQSQPSFYVRASCDHESRVYYEGDSLSIKLKCEVDAFIYAIYQQTDGQKYQIFPNSGQPNNRVQAGEEIVIPGKDDAFRWTVTAPFGKEQILVVASKEPLKVFRQAGAQQSKFVAISNSVLKGAGLELDQQTGKTWSEHLIEITTAPRPATPAPAAGGRRVGLFVGVGQYQWTEMGVISNLRFPVSDATLMGRTFKEIGGVSEGDALLLVDQMATKANIMKAVTELIPANTRPGDTVFIYFSGHGGQIPDEFEGRPGHDEVDGFDELICTYDLMNLDVLTGLLAADSDGKLEKKNPVVAQWVRNFVRKGEVNTWLQEYFKLKDELLKLKNVPDNDPTKMRTIKKFMAYRMVIDGAIARETGISDDEFGHWLQKLDGRKVVVILDACQSGGFAKNARKKPLQKDLNFRPAIFLDSTVGRLKDIGQRDVALFTAAPAELPSLESTRTWGGVMTYFLVNAMKQATGTLTLQQAFEHVKAGMADWFSKQSEDTRKQAHEPQLFNDCKTMPVLRP